MLTPSDFTKRWQAEVVAKSSLPDDDRLITAPADKLVGRPLSEATRQFLVDAGLPKSCGPCLTFDDLGKGLQRLWEVFAPGQWQPKEKVGLEHYGMIGSDGCGSPLCLDERDGRVVIVDHELLFDSDHEHRLVTLVNSSVVQLTESLLAVNTLPSASRMAALAEIDRPAVADGTFWYYDMQNVSDHDEDDDNGGDAAPTSKPWWKLW